MDYDNSGKFNKEKNEASWDDYAAKFDDTKRAELSKEGYGDLHDKMPCPKCGKPMLRAHQLTKEHEMASNPWFVKEDAKGNKIPMHKHCA